MKYSSKVPERQVFYGYLKTVNGLNNLTDQEIKLLSELMWSHKQFIEKDVYSLPGVNLFSTENKKLISSNLGITLANFYNLVSSLKKKDFILEEGRTDLILQSSLDKFVKEFVETGKAIVTFELKTV